MPHDLPLAAILGLRRGVVESEDLRAIQLAGLHRYTALRIATNLILALMTWQLYADMVPSWMIFGWLALLAVVIAGPIHLHRRALVERHGQIGRSHAFALVGAAALVALVWTIPLIVFAPMANGPTMAATWTIMAALVVASALLLNALPLGALAFNAVITLAAIGVYAHSGQFVMVGSVAAFSLLIAMAGIENARAFLMFNVSAAGHAEKDEVVSLLLREFEEGEADWLWQVDAARRIQHVSPRFAFAAGRDTSEIEGMPLLQLISGTGWDNGQFHASLHDLANKLKVRESFSNLTVRVSINGAIRWWELSASPKFDEQGGFMGFRGVGSDVTAMRESSEKIARMARYDNLTGLPNRLQLTEALDRALNDCQQWSGRCGFLMIDLDRFKSVNDTLGHLVGDRLLAQVSQRLRSVMGQDEVCGRLGGDEFAVVVRNVTDSESLDKLACSIIEILSRPYDVDQHTLYIGASVGSAVGPRDGATVETLMRSADLALYRSKDEGGGLHNCYEPRLHVHAEERRVMEFALRKALEKDEFSLTFQPVVSADTEGVVAFEALLRWYNPEFGQVSPAKFIPIAEDARLLVPIGNWVLHRACREATQWPSYVKLAVNVSAEQLHEPDFADTLVEALSESGLSPQRLELEVTESVFLREGSGVGAVLDKVLALGVGLALDDFGTGYSALGYLSKTRFTTIKVDRSFVQSAARNSPESIAIIRAVVAMAESLGMQTTAEGAETQHEVDVIRSLGCKKIQGYFYGRPMAAEDVISLFGDFRKVQFG